MGYPGETQNHEVSMLPPRPLTILTALLVLLVVPVSAQDSKPTGAAHKKKVTPLEKLMAAGEVDRSEALIEFIEDQIATGAVYAGQYLALRKLDWDVQKLLQTWISKAPRKVRNKDALRGACINALRDVVDEGKASDDLRDVLKQLAEDWFELAAVRRAAAYALAQFGDRSVVEKSIKEATKKAKAEGAPDQAQGWSELANIYYNLRQYDDTIKAYQQLIALGDRIRLSPGVFYNCGCSLALGGKKDEAFLMIEKALKLDTAGNLGERMLKTDMDIDSLRKDDRFAALMKKFFGKATAKPPTSQPTSHPRSRPAEGKK